MFKWLRTLINKRFTFVRRLYRNEVYAAYAYSLLWSEKLHREDGPAYVENYHKGGIRYQAYYKYNVKHREDGPAEIEYYNDGNYCNLGTPRYESYYLNGIYHREDGPAIIAYNKDGSIKSALYFVKDKRLTRDEWYTQLSTENKLKVAFGAYNYDD
jgi:hypothetical protein